MMTAHHINFMPVHLGPGWMATGAWATGGAIVLIEAQSQTGQVFKSRLDMHKAMFIDPLPIKASEDDIRTLVAEVNAVSDEPSW